MNRALRVQFSISVYNVTKNVTTTGDKRAMNRCELQWLFLSFLECLIDVLRLQPLCYFVNS